MATVLVGYDTEAAAVGEGLARFIGPGVPQYLPALEPESTVRGLELITRAHRDAGVPGTIFVCGRTLLHSLDALKAAKETGLFDVQQHTYSHLLFRDVEYSPEPGVVARIGASPAVALREEVAWTSRLVRDHLGHEPVGLRTPFGFYRGLRDRPDLLGVLRDTGVSYVSSWLRNEHGLNPTPWDVQPFAYRDEGFPEIHELPSQFWLDGIWFDTYGYDNGAGYLEALKGAIDHVAEHDLVYGACFHEWCMIPSNEEETGWLRGFLRYAVDRGVEVTTYTDYWRRLTNSGV
jgi:hypothetical protein